MSAFDTNKDTIEGVHTMSREHIHRLTEISKKHFEACSALEEDRSRRQDSIDTRRGGGSRCDFAFFDAHKYEIHNFIRRLSQSQGLAFKMLIQHAGAIYIDLTNPDYASLQQHLTWLDPEEHGPFEGDIEKTKEMIPLYKEALLSLCRLGDIHKLELYELPAANMHGELEPVLRCLNEAKVNVFTFCFANSESANQWVACLAELASSLPLNTTLALREGAEGSRFNINLGPFQSVLDSNSKFSLNLSRRLYKRISESSRSWLGESDSVLVIDDPETVESPQASSQAELQPGQEGAGGGGGGGGGEFPDNRTPLLRNSSSTVSAQPKPTCLSFFRGLICCGTKTTKKSVRFDLES